MAGALVPPALVPPALVPPALAVLVAVLTSSSPASAEAPDGTADKAEPVVDEATAPHEDDPEVHRFLPVLVPGGTLNSDEGIGGSLIFGLFHYHGAKKPFRDDLSLFLFATNKLVQRYELRWEGIDVFDLPLRTYARTGYYSTVTQNYCGFGNGVRCAPAVAERAALAAGLTSGTSDYEDFVRRYYWLRYIRLHADVTGRWRLRELPHKTELLLGWRFAWYIPGQIGELGPYPGSLYSRGFPVGEPGISSVPLVGIVVDNRDNEPAPNRGYFAEASVRGASILSGSNWTYAGFNTSFAGYLTLLDSPRIVGAARVLVDLIAGDAPVEEIAVTGGSRVLPSFGGTWIGRGVREHRYIGKIKVIQQLELRSGFLRWRVPWVNFDVGFGGALFLDAGWIGADWDDFAGGVPGVTNDGDDRGDPWAIVIGTGAGLRILVNDSFVVRIDLAYSPDEQNVPGLYMPVGNAF